jgi:hypothetical protein
VLAKKKKVIGLILGLLKVAADLHGIAYKSMRKIVSTKMVTDFQSATKYRVLVLLFLVDEEVGNTLQNASYIRFCKNAIRSLSLNAHKAPMMKILAAYLVKGTKSILAYIRVQAAEYQFLPEAQKLRHPHSGGA